VKPCESYYTAAVRYQFEPPPYTPATLALWLEAKATRRRLPRLSGTCNLPNASTWGRGSNPSGSVFIVRPTPTSTPTSTTTSTTTSTATSTSTPATTATTQATRDRKGSVGLVRRLVGLVRPDRSISHAPPRLLETPSPPRPAALDLRPATEPRRDAHRCRLSGRPPTHRQALVQTRAHPGSLPVGGPLRPLANAARQPQSYQGAPGSLELEQYRCPLWPCSREPP
jgi:hypothetical protein